MELSGIYTAARRIHKEYPILADRGISDVVGFGVKTRGHSVHASVQQPSRIVYYALEFHLSH
jgi:hypothetical protein